MHGHPIVTVEAITAALLAGAAVCLWNSPYLVDVPFIALMVAAFADLLWRRVPLVSLAFCLVLIIVSAVHLHATVTAVMAGIALISIPICRTLQRSRPDISLGDLASIALIGALAPAALICGSATATGAAFFFARRFKEGNVKVPIAGIALGITTAELLLTRTALYR